MFLTRRAASKYLAVNLPAIPQRPPVAPVQVPYVPDFWNSARSQPGARSLPKLHVVSGSATHYDGGPTYNLEKLQEDTSSPLACDAESLGSFSISRLRRQDEPAVRSRSLTDDERKGLYVLLGIVGGSWFVGALVNRSTVVAEEHGTH